MTDVTNFGLGSGGVCSRELAPFSLALAGTAASPRAECALSVVNSAQPPYAASGGKREPLVAGEDNRTARFGEALARLW